MLNFKKKNILIYGFGLSGKASYNYLKRSNNVKIYDDNINNLSLKIQKKILSKKKIIQSKFDFILVSPGINIAKCKLTKYILQNKKNIISELDVFYVSNPNNKIITITGTNGKSTTSKIIHDVLKDANRDVRIAGNIGNPLLNEKNIKPKTEFVIEASSYQIEYSQFFKSDVAIITNIYPDHLERHRTFSNYAKTKFKLIKNLKKKGICIIKKKNKILNFLIKKHKIKNKIFKIDSLPNKYFIKKIKNNYFTNINNLENLSFCLKVSEILKINKRKIIDTINDFIELPYRQQIIFNNNKLFIMNDSKSTSFSSSMSHLKSYKNIYWILGGIAKKGDKFTLEKKYHKNVKAYIYGKSKNFFRKKLKNKILIKSFNNLSILIDNLIIDASKDLQKKYIIFSPSSASFDQFKNFEHRGEYFNFMIKKKNIIATLNDKK